MKRSLSLASLARVSSLASSRLTPSLSAILFIRASIGAVRKILRSGSSAIQPERVASMTTPPFRDSSLARSSISLSSSRSPSVSLDISSRVNPRSSAICLKMVPEETYLRSKASASLLAWVDRPEPWSPLTAITSPLSGFLAGSVMAEPC